MPTLISTAWHSISGAPAPAPATENAQPVRERASLRERGAFMLDRAVRQIPGAASIVGLNWMFQYAVLKATDKLPQNQVLPWLSFAGHIGVSLGKEGSELLDQAGSRLVVEDAPGWWPYTRTSFSLRLISALMEAGCFTSGVVTAAMGRNQIRDVYGHASASAEQAAKVLADLLRNNPDELLTLCAQTAAFDWLHRGLLEPATLAAVPGTQYEFKSWRKPEWRDFFIRSGIGMAVRVGVTGLASSGWLKSDTLKSISGSVQPGYMIGDAATALVPAALRVAQPFIRDLLWRAYCNHGRRRTGDVEARPASLEMRASIEGSARDGHEHSPVPVAMVDPLNATPADEIHLRPPSVFARPASLEMRASAEGSARDRHEHSPVPVAMVDPLNATPADEIHLRPPSVFYSAQSSPDTVWVSATDSVSRRPDEAEASVPENVLAADTIAREEEVQTPARAAGRYMRSDAVAGR